MEQDLNANRQNTQTSGSGSQSDKQVGSTTPCVSNISPENEGEQAMLQVDELEALIDRLPKGEQQHFYVLRYQTDHRKNNLPMYSCGKFLPDPEEIGTDIIRELCERYTSPESTQRLVRTFTKVTRFLPGDPTDYLGCLHIDAQELQGKGRELVDAVMNCVDEADLKNISKTVMAIKIRPAPAAAKDNTNCSSAKQFGSQGTEVSPEPSVILFLFKTPVKMSKKRFYVVSSSTDNHLCKFEDDLLDFSCNISAVYYQEHLYLLDLQKAETFFNFERGLKIIGREKLESLFSRPLIASADQEAFDKFSMSGKNYLKLSKLDEGVLDDLENLSGDLEINLEKSPETGPTKVSIKHRPDGYDLQNNPEYFRIFLDIATGHLVRSLLNEVPLLAKSGTAPYGNLRGVAAARKATAAQGGIVAGEGADVGIEISGSDSDTEAS